MPKEGKETFSYFVFSGLTPSPDSYRDPLYRCERGRPKPLPLRGRGLGRGGLLILYLKILTFVKTTFFIY
jgi:hypothetical protein